MAKKRQTRSSKETSEATIIYYRPRIRLWRDSAGDWHVAGEPDGIALMLSAFRLVSRRLKARAAVLLRTDPIPKDRNPVHTTVVKMYERLVFSLSANDGELIVAEHDGDVVVKFSRATRASLGFAICETLDGWGDFSIPVTAGDRSGFMWFWGYANPHGANSF